MTENQPDKFAAASPLGSSQIVCGVKTRPIMRYWVSSALPDASLTVSLPPPRYLPHQLAAMAACDSAILAMHGRAPRVNSGGGLAGI